MACFWNRWIEDAHNDYGAHYFFIQLLKLVDDWPSEALPAIQTLLLEAINNKRPQFVKSKSVACLALNRLSKTIWINNLQQWISTVNSACWELRYAVLMGLESFGQGEDFDRVVLNFSRELKTQDPDPFVEKTSTTNFRKSGFERAVVCPIALNFQPFRAWYLCFYPQDLKSTARSHRPVADGAHHTDFSANHFKAILEALQLRLIHCFEYKVLPAADQMFRADPATELLVRPLNIHDLDEIH